MRWHFRPALRVVIVMGAWLLLTVVYVGGYFIRCDLISTDITVMRLVENDWEATFWQPLASIEAIIRGKSVNIESWENIMRPLWGTVTSGYSRAATWDHEESFIDVAQLRRELMLDAPIEVFDSPADAMTSADEIERRAEPAR